MIRLLLFIYYIHSIIIADSLWIKLVKASHIFWIPSSTITILPTKYLTFIIPSRISIKKTCRKLLEVRKRADQKDSKLTKPKTPGKKKINMKS